MENIIKDAIVKRRSVRTFSDRPLGSEDVKKLEECIAACDNPFGIKVEFRILNAVEHDLSSSVIVKARQYVAAKVEKVPQFEIAFGYSFEKFCLLAQSIGVGTVMLAATISRNTFEKAMELSGNEIMPLASPVGYTADKMSIREKLMRKAINADKRLPFESLFFDGTFERGLLPENAGKFREALEMTRLAPSAVNKQPWRAVVCGDKAHFYEKRNKGMENELGDVQKVDMGIAFAHLDLVMKESGLSGNFVVEDPGFEADETTEYIMTYRLNG